MTKKLLLASTSKYRSQLLAQLKVTFDTHAPIGVDEEIMKDGKLAPAEIARELAFQKAASLQEKFPNHIILGSDQVIALDNKILSKPGTKSKAIDQLKLLRGKTHILTSAVCMITENQVYQFAEDAKLTMRSDLTDDEICRYIEADNPIDCAGSYKIESLGPSLFEHIVCNDFTTITGLPLIKTARHLRLWGYQCP